MILVKTGKEISKFYSEDLFKIFYVLHLIPPSGTTVVPVKVISPLSTKIVLGSNLSLLNYAPSQPVRTTYESVQYLVLSYFGSRTVFVDPLTRTLHVPRSYDPLRIPNHPPSYIT